MKSLKYSSTTTKDDEVPINCIQIHTCTHCISKESHRRHTTATTYIFQEVTLITHARLFTTSRAGQQTDPRDLL